MGFSSVIVEGIILVAAIIAASVFAATFMGKVFEVKDTFTQLARKNVERLKAKAVIVYATYDKDLGCFLIFAKNVGKIPIKPINEINVYFGTLGEARPYMYSDTPTSGQWSFIEYGVENNIWELGETLELRVFNSTSVKTPYYIKIVLPQGGIAEEIFSQTIR
ncbi:MAG: hypothetical protein B6U76_02840 [Desulfurococcales archaeon ex4484_217_2]|nr:MAG: hypothetical protein B6U76_02840 [Desulfurococcales archaeon ex4484_217_2]